MPSLFYLPLLSSPSLIPPLPIANDITGKLASQAYPVPDKGIIVLSQSGKFVLFISSGKGHEMDGMQRDII